MANSKKRKKKPSAHAHRSAARGQHAKNPHRRGGGRRRGGSKRNPNYVTSGIDLLKSGFFALVGFVAARQIPQMFLGARNVGWLGYAANAATALALSAVASGLKAVGKDGAKAVLIGGGLQVTDRIIRDKLSPVSQYLSISGLGDPMTLAGIGPGYFPVPVPTDANGQPIIPAEIRALPPAVVAAASSAAMNAGLGMARTRYTSRFAS